MKRAKGYGTSGDPLDFFSYNESGQIWDAVELAWVAWVDADLADYRIPATEIGTSGRYEANIPEDTVDYILRFRGATLAESYPVYADAATHGLTAGQQAQLDGIESDANLIPAVKAKTDLLTANSEIVTITGDLASGERVCLYQGQDRVDATGTPLRLVDAGGTVLPAEATPLVFRAVHRSAGGQSFDADGSVELDGSDKIAVIQIPGSLHAALPRGDYSYFVFQVISGNLIDLDIAGDLQLLLGPGVYAG